MEKRNGKEKWKRGKRKARDYKNSSAQADTAKEALIKSLSDFAISIIMQDEEKGDENSKAI